MTFTKIRTKNAKLLFTDTDSLTYAITADDLYEDFFEDRDLFDNSDYPKDSKYHFAENKKVIGKFKDEKAGVPITEFVGLRSKMYSYIKENGTDGRTAKGIKNMLSRSRYAMSTINQFSLKIHNYIIK